MTLRLYDTMAGAVHDFVPVRAGHASIYLCGATVQGLPHIGHVRSGVAFDVLRRWLMAKGFDVTFIRNVTDIDDKIIGRAAQIGTDAAKSPPRSNAYGSCAITAVSPKPTRSART